VLTSGTDDATALAIAGFEVALLDRDYPAAFHALTQALAFDPNSSLALAFSAIVHAFAGNVDAAAEFAAKADRQSPLDPLRWINETARTIAAVHAGRLEDAVRSARAALQIAPGMVAAHLFLIAAHVGLGQMADAQLATRQLMAVAPQYRLSMLGDVTIGPPEKAALMMEALRAAGLPE
jgi:tetratricopeptide (TPR) repeat protein